MTTEKEPTPIGIAQQLRHAINSMPEDANDVVDLVFSKLVLIPENNVDGPAAQAMFDIEALRRVGEWMDRVTAQAFADTYGTPPWVTLWRKAKHNKAK